MNPANEITPEQLDYMAGGKRRRFSKNKYGAKKTQYNGVTYDSKAEAKYAATLDHTLKLGAIIGWSRQAPFRMSEFETYRVDFLVTEPDGRTHAVDVKGVETAKFRRVRKWWSAYGPYPLHIVKGGKTVDRIIPDRWLRLGPGD